MSKSWIEGLNRAESGLNLLKREKRGTSITLLLMLLLLLVCLTACNRDQHSDVNGSNGNSSASELITIHMASWSKPITEQVNVLAAEHEGWFANRGIQFQFIPGAGSSDAIKNIISGQADIAFADPFSVYAALAKGEKLKIIYNIYPQNVFNVVSLKESGIEKLADLKGKTIGVYSLASGTYFHLLLLLHEAGLTEDDVTIVETGVLNFAPLMQGQVDATAATDTGLADARLKGIGEVNVIEVKDYLNVPSDLFVVTEETYNNRKQDLQRFLEVYQQSAQWMIDQPEAAAAIAKQHAIDGIDEERNLQMIELRNTATVDELTEKQGLGALDSELLQLGADRFWELGLLDRQLELQKVIVTDLLPGVVEKE